MLNTSTFELKGSILVGSSTIEVAVIAKGLSIWDV